MKDIIYPNSLIKGSKIAVISPAGMVDEEQIEIGLNILKSKCYEIVLGSHVFSNYEHGYNYAGTEDERLSDLNWALNDPEISAVWATRGGYGCQHLIQNISLSGFKSKPKWYIGYSDNTVINSYLLKNGYASMNAQTLKTSSFGVSKDSYEDVFKVLEGELPEYETDHNKYNKEGKTEGQIVGGNLALVYALLGTHYSFNFKDKILFLEEIGENYYALDRMMMSLDLAGVFNEIKGLVVGGMINMGKEGENIHYEDSFDPMAMQIISERIVTYSFPTLFGFQNGHIYDNHPLIIGANVSLKVGHTNVLKHIK